MIPCLTSKSSLHTFFFLQLLPLTTFFLLAIFSQPYKVYDYYFNPDSLYLATLYESLFIDGNSLFTNYLNPSLLLIPDVVIFFLLRFLTGDVIVASFFFSIIQHLFIFVGILFIFKIIKIHNHTLIAGFSGLLFMFFFLGAIFSGDIIFAAFSLVSTNHTGAFVTALFSVALLLQYLQKPVKTRLFWLIILVIFSSLSDKLFILMFAIPVLIILSHNFWVKRENKFLITIVSVVAGVLSSILLQIYIDGRFVNIQKLPGVFQIERIAPAFVVMMRDLGNYLMAGDSHTLIIVLSLVSLAAHLFLSIRFLKRKKVLAPSEFYLIFSTLVIILLFWMPVTTGNYVAKHILRYNIGAFYLAILNLPLVTVLIINEFNFHSFRNNKMPELLYSAIFVTMLIISTININKTGVRNFFDYYPDFVRELDEISEKEELLNGVAHFWNAKPITVFSKQAMKVYHTFDPFVPYYHVTSKMYYIGENQVFNFALISNFSDKTGYLQYLNHEGRKVKNGNTEVLILPPFKFDKYTGLPYFIEQQHSE